MQRYRVIVKNKAIIDKQWRDWNSTVEISAEDMEEAQKKARKMSADLNGETISIEKLINGEAV